MPVGVVDMAQVQDPVVLHAADFTSQVVRVAVAHGDGEDVLLGRPQNRASRPAQNGVGGVLSAV